VPRPWAAFRCPSLDARQIPALLRPELPDVLARQVLPAQSEMFASDASACVHPGSSLDAALEGHPALPDVAVQKWDGRAVSLPQLQVQLCKSVADLSAASQRDEPAVPALPLARLPQLKAPLPSRLSQPVQLLLALEHLQELQLQQEVRSPL
jgi:hypothetical protein